MKVCGEAMSDSYPPIPYGLGHFPTVRRDGFYYVDKTRFVRELEKVRFAFFVRPRRFGKTLWLTMLDAYYNRIVADKFEAVFAGTDIGANPTANRSRYLVLYFDFSAVKQALPTLEAEFEGYCATQLAGALRRNHDLFDDAAQRDILAGRSIGAKLAALFQYVRDHDIPLYVLIDEYDNFANTILSGQGAHAYGAFTDGGGFYRDFFGTLKAGTAEAGGIERLFITGVSPVTMDGVTGGFNIGTNISLRPEFNETLGFREGEVRAMLETYRKAGAIREEVHDALATMREWYGGYRFAETAREDLYNTHMVLYYLNESIARGHPPERLIGRNVREHHGRLRQLIGRQQAEGVRRERGAAELKGNFDLLRQVIEEEGAYCDLRDGFPLRELAKRENFLSLLHCFGLLSIRGRVEGRLRLGIPNQTVKKLMYGILRDAHDDASVPSVDISH